MRYKQILVMGAGAVGGYFGGRLAKRTDRQITMIARGAHLAAIQDRGLEIRSPKGDSRIEVPAFRTPSEAEKPDLILFTVKSYDTEATIEQIRPVVSERTQILTIQNGIENYVKLREAFGDSRVIRGLCRIGATVTAPGTITHNSMGSVVVGEADGARTERVNALEELFRDTNIDFKISGNILHEVWVKFAWNCIFNMVTGIAVVTIDKLFRDPASEKLCYDLFEELRSVAKAEGVVLSGDDRERIIENARKLEGFTTSTYNDRKKGKKLEYEAFTGAVIRLGEEHDLALPHHQTLYALLKMVDNMDK